MTGGATPELELILAEGAGLRGGYNTPDFAKNRNRCRIAQHPIDNGPFNNIRVPFSSLNGKHYLFLQSGSTYGALFNRAMRDHGMLCIGLYRYNCDALKITVILIFLACTTINRMTHSGATSSPIHHRSSSSSQQIASSCSSHTTQASTTNLRPDVRRPQSDFISCVSIRKHL